MYPQTSLSLRFLLSLPLGRRKLLISPRQRFSPEEKGGEETARVDVVIGRENMAVFSTEVTSKMAAIWRPLSY